MAVNPMDLIKLKGRLDLFAQQHPKFGMFMKDAGEQAMMPGTILEIKVTTPDGRDFITNIRLTPEDVETMEIAKNVRH